MKRLIGAAIVASMLALGGAAAINPAAAASPQIKTQTAGAPATTDFSARRYYRRYYRPYYRPYYYATALLLSAVSLRLAGAVSAGSGFRAVLVVSDDWTLMD
jgi:hypothetical protein